MLIFNYLILKCYSVFVRGKKKFVHDCSFTLDISGTKEFSDINGEIKLSDVSNHTEDDDFDVKR